MSAEEAAMPRLVLSLDGVVLREVTLTKDRTTIGRRSHNDVVIDNLAVSGEHAVMIANGHDTYLEDLGSTNGTTVNGQPIKKHLLQSGDTVEIGKYRLRYQIDGASNDDNGVDIDTSQPLRREFYGPGPNTIQVRTPGGAADAPARFGDDQDSDRGQCRARTDAGQGAHDRRSSRPPGGGHHAPPDRVFCCPRRRRSVPHGQRAEPGFGGPSAAITVT
jgi:hypothetical protein